MIDFAIQIAEALDAAHRRGIIHRDIKPANLFVTHGDRVKVLDFGLGEAGRCAVARRPPRRPRRRCTGVIYSPDLTRTGSAVGTASYMAPEQAQGQPVDARPDLFSLGTVLYEMVTGRRAFGGDDIPLIVMKIVNGICRGAAHASTSRSRKPRGHHPEADGDVDPNARYQSAGELLETSGPPSPRSIRNRAPSGRHKRPPPQPARSDCSSAGLSLPA